MSRWFAAAVAAAVALAGASAGAQEAGTVQGTVTLVGDAGPVRGAMVLVVGTGATTLTEDDGTYALENVPAGTYEVLAQREHLTAGRQMITVAAGEVATADFELAPSPVHEQVTVTAAAGGTETTFEAFNAVTTLDSFDLIQAGQNSLGDALQNEPGIAVRSFGPGSSRPIIRGFDGDRVLILDDGVRTGDLSSQSGDHGVTIDPNGAERIEIVRGPATLLYGSNAVGGLVNIISPHEAMHESMFEGTRAQLSTDFGSANGQAGVNVNMQHSEGALRVWAGGSTRRTGDYDTPEGSVPNSATELSNARAGAGYDNGTFFASGGFTFEQGRYGVPFAEEFHGAHDVHDTHDAHDAGHGDEGEDEHEGEEGGLEIDLASRRQVGRIDLGLRNLSNRLIDGLRVTMNVIDWGHDELEVEDGFENVGTSFDNRTYIVRAEFDQRQTERLSGRFGAWTQVRDFQAAGFEALAPRTDLTSMAAFAYEEVDFGRVRLQFGGRIERNSYRAGDRMIGLHSEDRDDHDDHDDDHDDHDHDEDDEDDHDDHDHGEDDEDDHDDHDDHDHGEDDEDDHDDHDDHDHGEDDEDDHDDHDDHDHGEDDDDHGEDDHDDHDHGEDDDDHGEDDHDDHDHGEDDHDDHDHGEDDHDDDHGEDDHDEDDHDDHDDHDDEHLVPVPDPRDRAFLGASASVGVHVDLGERSAFVANFTSTHRAPALEELYNYGPHVGNLAFEVGNPNLRAEETLGLDVSLRTRTNRVRGELNAYVYDIDGFIFGDRTDRTLDGLPVFNFVQGDSRFRGMDARGSVRLGGRAWATVGLGYVDARLTATNQPLPRIPPLRGTLQLDIPYGDFTVSPQLMYAARQDAVFRGETETEGYSVVNVSASYTWPRRHAAHVLTFTGYNLTNTLYRNHTSFIKDLAPEMGRGIRVAYSLRFF